MTRRDSGDNGGCGSSLIGRFKDNHSVVLAKAVVEREQSAAQPLDQFAENGAAILRVLGERLPGFGGVGKSRHVKGHLFLLFVLSVLLSQRALHLLFKLPTPVSGPLLGTLPPPLWGEKRDQPCLLHKTPNLSLLK